MREWPISKIRLYCLNKGWKLTVWTVRENSESETSLRNKEKEFKMNGNNDYSGLWATVGRAKSMGGGYAPKLEIGNHRLALKNLKVKDSTKGLGQYVEAEFVVVESTVHAQGESRGWVWFINASGQFAAAYEQDRLKKFCEAAGACLGDNSPPEVIGAALAGPDQNGMGLIIDCSVQPQTGKNAGKTNSRGELYTNIYWKPVKQSLEDLAASRAELESMEPAAPVVTTPPPAPAPTPAATTPVAGGIFGRKLTK